jgi:hypothetical protein
LSRLIFERPLLVPVIPQLKQGTDLFLHLLNICVHLG